MHFVIKYTQHTKKPDMFRLSRAIFRELLYCTRHPVNLYFFIVISLIKIHKLYNI